MVLLVQRLSRKRIDGSLRIKEVSGCRGVRGGMFCVPSPDGEQVRWMHLRQFARALFWALSKTEQSDWSDGIDDWAWLRLRSRPCKRAERDKMAGGIANPERVDRHVDLVSANLAKFGGRAGWSAARAILVKISCTLPREVSFQ